MYTELLEDKDFENLSNLIRFYEDKEHTKPINYKIVTSTHVYYRGNKNPVYVLFLRDYSCSFTYVNEKTSKKMNEVYRNYMINRMTPTHPEYEDKLNNHLEHYNKSIITD